MHVPKFLAQWISRHGRFIGPHGDTYRPTMPLPNEDSEIGLFNPSFATSIPSLYLLARAAQNDARNADLRVFTGNVLGDESEIDENDEEAPAPAQVELIEENALRVLPGFWYNSRDMNSNERDMVRGYISDMVVESNDHRCDPARLEHIFQVKQTGYMTYLSHMCHGLGECGVETVVLDASHLDPMGTDALRYFSILPNEFPPSSLRVGTLDEHCDVAHASASLMGSSIVIKPDQYTLDAEAEVPNRWDTNLVRSDGLLVFTTNDIPFDRLVDRFAEVIVKARE